MLMFHSLAPSSGHPNIFFEIRQSINILIKGFNSYSTFLSPFGVTGARGSGERGGRARRRDEPEIKDRKLNMCLTPEKRFAAGIPATMLVASKEDTNKSIKVNRWN